MTTLIHIVLALLVAAAGCWLATRLLPAGPPRLIAQVASVLAGFTAYLGSAHLL